jgi:hypothetical protein
VGVLGVYSVLLLDTAARAREAVRTADQYAVWEINPEARKRGLEELFQKVLSRTPSTQDKGALSSEAQALALDLLRVRHAAVSALPASGSAYQWYRDAYRTFSPPENAATRKARLMAPAFKFLWRKQWVARGLPTRDTFWDDEPGIAPHEKVVYSARRRKEADRAQETLVNAGVLARVQTDPRPAGAGDGYWVVVPEDRFGMAHQILLLHLGLPAIVVEFS